MSFSLSSLFRQRWVRLIACAVAGLAALWLLAWLLVPWLVHTQVEHRGTERLGRQVTVGQVVFRPWSLELDLQDVAVASADGASQQLQVSHIYIDAALLSLWKWAPVIDALQVECLRLKVTRYANGALDVDDVLARLAARPPAPQESQPARFAFYNLALHDGAVQFDDQTVGRVHTLQRGELALPFVSNLPAYRDVKVSPKVAFELNGTAFESDALSTPFTDDRKTAARLQMAGLDVTAFAGYLQPLVPARIKSGTLSADMRLEFEQAAGPQVKLSGHLQMDGVALTDRRDHDWLGFESLKLVLRDVRPLQKEAHFDDLQVTGLRGHVRRTSSGRLELLDGGADARAEAASAGAKVPASGPATSSAPARTESPGWTVSLRQADIHAGSLDWTDAATGAEPARIALRHLRVHGSDMAWPLQRPLRFAGAAQVAGGGSDAEAAAGQLAISGEAGARHATVAVSLRRLSADWAAPYLKDFLQPRLQGRLDADLGLAWNGSAFVAKVARVALEDVALSCAAPPASCTSLGDAGVAPAVPGQARLADVRRLELTNVLVHPQQRTLHVGRLALDQPRAVVARGADGRWMFQDWAARNAPATSADGAAGRNASGAPPWDVQVQDLSVDAAAVGFRDLSQGRPVALNLSALQVRARDVQPLAAQAPASPLSVSAQVASGRFEPGRLRYEGNLALQPLSAEGRLEATRLPLHAFEPYFGDRVNVAVARAEASFQGVVRHQSAPGGSSTWVRGDGSLDDVRVRSKLAGTSAPRDPDARGSSARGEELLQWKALHLRGLDVADVAGQPLAVQVAETSLNDFFARIVVQEDGRINLQDMVKPARASTQADPATPGTGGGAVPAAGGVVAQRGAAVVRVGPVALAGGTVRFTDRFVKPSYSADLTELTGRLGAFSSEAAQDGAAPQMADLELRGRAEGTASLEVAGQLNPLAKPLALDIKGRVRDLELPPLSPYSVKYAGHGIERGKLSMDVTYRVLPDGQLTASNKLVLHQLAFGEPVQGAPASLPVRLAVALLADRNGVIDVDLPITGSLNDPEFRLSSVLLRVIGNLVMKAVTAPFSLLAGAFSGSGELSTVDFDPGSAALTAEARQKLDLLAQSLADRPALQLTVAGEARLDVEADAWKKAQLQARLQAAKRRAALRSGQPPIAQDAAVTSAEYPELLGELYRRADIDKPRNLVGMAKTLPVQEMEALLLADMSVPDSAMRELAVARSVAVRDYLAQRQVPLERLFVGAARTSPPADGWAPRAELHLATR